MPDLDRIRRYFDTEAERYDGYAAGDAWTPNQHLAAALRDLVADGVAVTTVLDLGAGTGQTLAAVREVFPEADLTGVDLSGEMLARARSRVPSARLLADDVAHHAATDTGRYDLVTAIGCSENVPDLPVVLRDVVRLLAPSGHLALTVEPLAHPGGPEGEHWTVPGVLAVLPDCEPVTQERFVAYYRVDVPVHYDLLVVRRRG